MSKGISPKLGQQLLQQSRERDLTPAEVEQLQQYQGSEHGEQVTAVHSLLSEQAAMNQLDDVLSKQQLRRVAAQINEKVTRKKRRQQVQVVFRSVAGVTAVVVLFLGLAALIQDPTAATPEPPRVILPTRVSPTPMPTPIPPTATPPPPTPTPKLLRGQQYVDLAQLTPEPLEQLADGVYGQTVAEVQAVTDFDILVPSQIGDNFSFVGVMANPDSGSVEIALRTHITVDYDRYPLWILSQRPAESDENVTLPVMLEFFDEGSYEIKEYYNNETAVNGHPAHYLVQEQIVDMQKWMVVNTLSWQEQGQQFTLTLMIGSVMPERTLVNVAEKYVLTPFKP